MISFKKFYVILIPIFIYIFNFLFSLNNNATFTTFLISIFLLIGIKYTFYDFEINLKIYDNLNIFTKKNHILNIFLLLIFTIITQNKFLNIETISWDVASYLVASQEIESGYIPLETQWESKGPLFMYLYFLINKLSLNNFVYFKIANDLILFVTSVFIYFTVSNVSINKILGFFSSLLFLSITSYTWFISELSEIYCLVLLSIIYFLESRKYKNIFLIGLLFSFSTLINQGTAVFIIPYAIYKFYNIFIIKSFKKLFNFLNGLLIPHIFFIILYLSRGLLDVYVSQYLTLPLNYIQENLSSFYELKVVLRTIFNYDLFLYLALLTTATFIFVDLMNRNNKNLKAFNILQMLNLLFGLGFYFLAGHNYYHHLFYFVFFISLNFVNLNSPKYIKVSYLYIFIASISILIATAGSSLSNLSNLKNVYDDYPLKKLSKVIDSSFEDDSYNIMALDSVLVLYYLEKPNFSYIIHPSNHFEKYIVDDLIRLNRIKTNSFNHISYLIEKEPEVIICNGRMIIQGKVEDVDFYNCAVDDYKKNYKKINTEEFLNSKYLDFYKDPYKEINVFIKSKN
tara:strand:+ start:9072 stop:10778 length:1707 start_codon:yes stop_codon:yes gene_type:complete